MKQLVLLILVSTLLITSIQAIHAQTTPIKQWDKAFGGSDSDLLHAFQQTTDGGYILGGGSRSNISSTKSQPSKGSTDFWVVKIEASGNKQWDKTIGGSGIDILYALQQTSDGGYILAGSSSSLIGFDKTQNPKGGTDIWVVKLDASGNKQWDKTIGGSSGDWANSVMQTTDGGYIVGGRSNSPISGDKTQASTTVDYWIVKLDANGNKLWDKTFGGSNEDNFSVVIQTADGGYFLGGYSMSNMSGDKSQNSKGYFDYWVIKLDQAGNKIWDKTIGGSSSEQFSSVVQSPDGGYLLGGHSASPVSSDKTQPLRGFTDYWIVKIDGSGNIVWDKTIGGTDRDYFFSLDQTNDGGYILGGWSNSPVSFEKTEPNIGTTGAYDFWIVRINSIGNVLWDKVIGGDNTDEIYGIEQTTDGGYALSGLTQSGISGDKTQPSNGAQDYWIVKLSPSCFDLNAVFDVGCSGSGTSLSVNVYGTQPASTVPSWTLTYTLNGTTQTQTGTTSNITLGSNLPSGSIYKLVSISSGTCVKNLNDSVTIQAIPAAPTVTATSICGTGSVTLTATGAPSGGRYVLYDAATGGLAISSNNTGTFNTSVISNTTTFYVSSVNSLSCEGPRTAVNANILPLPIINAGPNETVFANASPVQLAGFSPSGGIWTGQGVSSNGLFTPSLSMVGNHTLTYTYTSVNSCTDSATKIITIPTPPVQPLINLVAPDTLISSISGDAYEWRLNGTSLTNTTRKIQALASGTYEVRVINISNGPSAFSPGYNFYVLGNKGIESCLGIVLFPNPTFGIINLEVKDSKPSYIEIYNTLGQLVLTSDLKNNSNQIDLSKEEKGIYMVKVVSGDQVTTKKIVLQ